MAGGTQKNETRGRLDLRDWKSVDAAYQKWKRSPEARIDIEKYVPKWLIETLKKPSVRGWIERRLDENPNFFMPWIFWNELGFREVIEKKDREKPLGVYPEWSHPYDTRLTSPKFGEYLHKMDVHFIFAKIYYEKGDNMAAFIEIYNGIGNYYRQLGFYEAWKLLREVHRLRDLDIFKPIDHAFIREIGGKQVDLAEVYWDLKEGRRSIFEAVKAIQSGGYDYTPSAIRSPRKTLAGADPRPTDQAPERK